MRKEHIRLDSHHSTCQFQDVHSPDKLNDYDIVSGTLEIFIPPIKKPRRKVYLYQKGDYESMRKDTLKFAKEKYFSGHSDTRSVQENIKSEMRSFKSNENIHKKEGGSYYVVSGERGGSGVECRTPEREVRGSRPTSAVLCP